MNPGDKVRFTSADAHERDPQFYPAPGTVGTVYRIDDEGDPWVEWPAGSTDKPYRWCASKKNVEVVEE